MTPLPPCCADRVVTKPASEKPKHATATALPASHPRRLDRVPAGARVFAFYIDTDQEWLDHGYNPNAGQHVLTGSHDRDNDGIMEPIPMDPLAFGGARERDFFHDCLVPGYYPIRDILKTRAIRPFHEIHIQQGLSSTDNFWRLLSYDSHEVTGHWKLGLGHHWDHPIMDPELHAWRDPADRPEIARWANEQVQVLDYIAVFRHIKDPMQHRHQIGPYNQDPKWPDLSAK